MNAEELARQIFQQAIAENRCAEVVQCMFDGGSVTIDASGQLAFISGEQVNALLGSELCPCGLPLHYENARSRQAVERLVEEHGELQTVSVEGKGSWRIPRHYIALHGLAAPAIEEVAARCGFERVS